MIENVVKKVLKTINNQKDLKQNKKDKFYCIMKNFGLKPVYWIYTFVCLFNFLGKLSFVLKRILAIYLPSRRNIKKGVI